MDCSCNVNYNVIARPICTVYNFCILYDGHSAPSLNSAALLL